LYTEEDIRAIKLFKCLSNGTRYQMLKVLEKESKCVNELAELLNKKPENISQHLKILRDLNLVSYKTLEHKVMYSLKNQEIIKVIEHMIDIVSRK